jgi:hypothetical protein
MADIFEEAPSGRSKCRACQQKIDKGALRYDVYDALTGATARRALAQASGFTS